MGTTRVNFRIPEELVEKADVAAKVTHRNRTEIVTEALRECLDEFPGSTTARPPVSGWRASATQRFSSPTTSARSRNCSN
jgi:metal-responsive CopG/Arc/MetJ family transcriptional regulator